MAILDNEMIMSKAQTVTATGDTASTGVIDFGVNGAGRDKKIIVSVNTTCTSGGAATVAAAVEHSADNSAFTALNATTAAGFATMTAGTKVLEYVLPSDVKRYVRVKYTVATAALTAGKFNAYLDTAIQTNMI